MEYRPPWGVCDFIMRKACWAHKNEPVRLVWTQPIQSSYVISSNGTGGVPVPALLNLLKERNMAGPRSTATRVYEVGNAGRGKGGKPDVQNVNTAELAAHRIKQCGHGRGIRHIGYARVRIFRRTTCCRSSRKSSLGEPEEVAPAGDCIPISVIACSRTSPRLPARTTCMAVISTAA